MTMPTPPGGPGEIALLRVLVNDVDEPHHFSDAALAFILTLTPDMTTAAGIAWRWKAIQVGDPNRITQGQIGNESFTFPSLKDILDWANGLGDFWDGLRDREKNRGLGDPVMLWLKSTEPCFYGISGPYSCENGGGSGQCVDVTRYGYHGVTG
jgi:hypothetical protein